MEFLSFSISLGFNWKKQREDYRGPSHLSRPPSAALSPAWAVLTGGCASHCLCARCQEGVCSKVYTSCGEGQNHRASPTQVKHLSRSTHSITEGGFLAVC